MDLYAYVHKFEIVYLNERRVNLRKKQISYYGSVTHKSWKFDNLIRLSQFSITMA